MGLFGFGKAKQAEYCPICGEEMKDGLLGAGTAQTADGKICVLCWQRFREKSQADLKDLTTDFIRDIIEGNDGMTGEPCAVCGKSMDRNAFPIADGVICASCERLLRGMYFKDDGDGDFLEQLDVQTVKEDIDVIQGHMKKALEQFPDAKAVAYVDDCFMDGKRMILSVGVAKGAFDIGDEVVLVHDGAMVDDLVVGAFEAKGLSYEGIKQQDKSGYGDPFGAGSRGWLAFEDTDPNFDLDDVVYKK